MTLAKTERPNEMSDVIIRPVRREDRDEWQTLWTAYLAFYESTVTPEVYGSTFERLLNDGDYEPSAFVAELDGNLVGLVHYIPHRHCWRTENVCYLQDLFAAPHVRGKGIGRALIEAVYAEADRQGWGSVYWLTQDFNADARKLYDRVATLTPFIKYQR